METRLNNITSILDDKKGQDIQTINLVGQGYICDYVVITTALNDKHSLSLVDTLKEELKPLGEEFLRTEDDPNWSIIDLGDIIIHIMTQSHREKYNLEEFLSQLDKAD